MTGTLLLDLDGTLVDSVPDLAAALNRLMAARGLAALLGRGDRHDGRRRRPRLVERAFAARGRVADEAAIETFMADYASHLVAATRPTPMSRARSGR